MSTTLPVFLSGMGQEEDIDEHEKKEASEEDPKEQQKRTESNYEGNNESQDIESGCKCYQ